MISQDNKPEVKDKIPVKEPKELLSMAAQEVDIVTPSVSPAQAIAAFKAYQEMCNGLLDASDYQTIKTYQAGKGLVAKPFKKKTAWRKLATAYNLSDHIISEVRKDYEKMEYKEKKPNTNFYYTVVKPGFVIEVTVECRAKNGRVTTGIGSCSSNERGFAHMEHDVRSTAHTRAKSRAISDMIGAGEVSAEEMEEAEERKNGSCSIDHTKITPIASKKDNKNKGRMYIRCDRCGYWKWLDSTIPGTPLETAAPVSTTEPNSVTELSPEEEEPDPTDLF
jgi:hypothetical protein